MGCNYSNFIYIFLKFKLLTLKYIRLRWVFLPQRSFLMLITGSLRYNEVLASKTVFCVMTRHPNFPAYEIVAISLNKVINSWGSITYIHKHLSNKFFANHFWFILMCYFQTGNFKLTKPTTNLATTWRLKYKQIIIHSKEYSEEVGHQIWVTWCNFNEKLRMLLFLTHVY